MALYQNTSNYGPGVEINSVLWVLGFHIEIKKEIFRNLLVPNRKGHSFDIWHVASSSGPLPKFFKLWPWSGNWSYVVGSRISHRDKEGNF